MYISDETFQIVQILGIIITSLGVVTAGIAFIIIWHYRISLRITRSEDNIKEINIKLDKLPKQIEEKILAGLFEKYAIMEISSQNNPLTADQINDRNELLIKLKDKTISIEEAKELQTLLRKEEREAKLKEKWGLLLALAITLSLIALILPTPKKQ